MLRSNATLIAGNFAAVFLLQLLSSCGKPEESKVAVLSKLFLHREPLFFTIKQNKKIHYYQMATPLTTEVLELVLDENNNREDVDELYYLGSDDELEYNFDE